MGWFRSKVEGASEKKPLYLPTSTLRNFANRTGLVVQMECRQMRVQTDLVGASEADMEYFRLDVIEPHDGMKMGRHNLILSARPHRVACERMRSVQHDLGFVTDH